MENIEHRERMKARTKAYALRVIRLVQHLPQSQEGKVLGNQLLRSATSVAANYRAACRARSGRELFSKLSIVVEEADESLFWMELLVESGIVPSERLNELMAENIEILKIMATARKNTKVKN